MVVAATADLVHTFYADLWNRWDDARVDLVLSPSFAFRGSLGTSTTGRSGWRAYRDGVRAGSADFHNELVSLVVDGDTAAARLSYTGTHSGPLLGVPATGRRFAYAGAAFFTVEDGMLASAWVLGDIEGLRRQLGG